MNSVIDEGSFMDKRILFVESRYNSYYGAQQSMVKLIGVLARGFRCEVLTTKKGRLAEELERMNIPVRIIKLGARSNEFNGKVLKYGLIQKLAVVIELLMFNLRVLQYIFTNKIRIVYVNDARSLIYVGMAAKLLRCKVIYYIRADVEHNWITRLCFLLSNKVITIAQGVLRRLPSSFRGRYAHKTMNIYTGFEFDKEEAEVDAIQLRKKFGIQDHRFVIGYVGSIHPRKGLDVLVNVLEKIGNDHELTLLMAGDASDGQSEYWGELQDRLRQSEVQVIHVGYQRKLAPVYSVMDALVLPSRSEGLPRTVIEAMSFGVPVIATDVGGVKEIIPSEEYGIVIPHDDEEALQEAIQYMRSSPDYRRGVHTSAKRYVREKFNHERFEHEVLSLFTKIS